MPRPIMIPVTGDPAVRKLFALIRVRKRTITAVADRAGVSERTMRSWRNGVAPTLPHLQAALQTFGYTLVAVSKNHPAARPLPVPSVNTD